MDPPKVSKPLRKNRIRKRNVFKHVKRHVKPKSLPLPSESQPTDSSDNLCLVTETFDELEYDLDEESVAGSSASASPSLTEHDYAVTSPECRPSSSLSRPGSSLSRPGSSLSHISNVSGSLSVSMSDVSVSEDASQSGASSSNSFRPISPIKVWHEVPEKESVNKSLSKEKLADLLLLARKKLFLMLPQNFVPIIDQESLNVLMIGLRQSKAVQRQVTVSLSGDIEVQVHGKDFPAHLVMSGVRAQLPLSERTCGVETL